MKSHRAFTLIELLVVISIIALLIAILLPALGAARRTAQAMQSNTQLRGIQQGITIYAQSNKNLYPGMLERNVQNPNISLVDAPDIPNYNVTFPTTAGMAGGDVPARYIICLRDDAFSPDYLISPFEINTNIQPWEENVVYNGDSLFYSYALPRIVRSATEMSPGRSLEWEANANASAVVVSDRLYRNGTASPIASPGDASTHYSLQSTDTPGSWTGGVTFNDNHTESYKSSEIDNQLSYGGIKTDGPDNIFSAAKVGNQRITDTRDDNQHNAQQIVRRFDGTMTPTD